MPDWNCAFGPACCDGNECEGCTGLYLNQSAFNGSDLCNDWWWRTSGFVGPRTITCLEGHEWRNSVNGRFEWYNTPEAKDVSGHFPWPEDFTGNAADPRGVCPTRIEAPRKLELDVLQNPDIFWHASSGTGGWQCFWTYGNGTRTLAEIKSVPTVGVTVPPHWPDPPFYWVRILDWNPRPTGGREYFAPMIPDQIQRLEFYWIPTSSGIDFPRTFEFQWWIDKQLVVTDSGTMDYFSHCANHTVAFFGGGNDAAPYNGEISCVLENLLIDQNVAQLPSP